MLSIAVGVGRPGRPDRCRFLGVWFIYPGRSSIGRTGHVEDPAREGGNSPESRRSAGGRAQGRSAIDDLCYVSADATDRIRVATGFLTAFPARASTLTQPAGFRLTAAPRAESPPAGFTSTSQARPGGGQRLDQAALTPAPMPETVRGGASSGGAATSSAAPRTAAPEPRRGRAAPAQGSQQRPLHPIFTPATKAASGHDENIPFLQMEVELEPDWPGG